MITFLGYCLLAAGLWCLAAAAICWLFARIVRGLSKNPRPAHPLPPVPGGSFPVVTAAGVQAPRIRRGTPPTPSSLALLPGGEGGPADPNSAGPTNSTP